MFRVPLTAMLGTLVVSGAAVLSPLSAPSSVRAENMSPRQPVIAGYLPAWSATPESIAALPAQALTHILYAFGSVTEDGHAALGNPCLDVGLCDTSETGGGNFAALAALKERYPDLQVLISVGGWTGSQHFSDAASTSEGRERLAASLIDLFLGTYGHVFDGIDIDWEYPVEGGLPDNSRRPEDRENFTLLIEELRRQFNQFQNDGRSRPLLTIATTGSPWFMRNLDVSALAQHVDWIGIMTYEYAAGASATNFNSPLFPAVPGDPQAQSLAISVEAYLAAGAPPDRLVVGLPFYGHVFRQVDPGPSGDGLFQQSAAATSHAPNENTITYRTLVSADLESHGFRHYRHAHARVPWLYQPETGTWISYDDVDSLRDKATFTRLRGLRGVMVWELTGDDGTLIEAIRSALID